ncbi:hypothetical protein, partial [Klebsiella pneumoniae]|uniref:hypothetical protein n=1 Tax=Klebsiella pneumoniae TaxID=573 RepID=UPI003B5ACE78
MMNDLYLVLVFGGAYLAGFSYVRYCYYKTKKAEREAEVARKETQAISKELENAEQRKKIEQANRRLTAHGVDEQLQSKGW